MKTVTVGNLTIGTGLPKICVPIIGTTLDEIRSQAIAAASCSPDLVEWRGDWFQEITDLDKIDTAFAVLREELKDIPVLYTFRTASEGGAAALPVSEYCRVLQYILEQKLADLVDIELFIGGNLAGDLVQQAHAADIPVILSNHDFSGTPEYEVLWSRLSMMEALGCDIAKIAMMPQTSEDVLTLLRVTEAYSKTAGCPLITMSMTQLGLISRLCGSLTGSALTFGTAGNASAPGQIPVPELRSLLRILQI